MSRNDSTRADEGPEVQRVRDRIERALPALAHLSVTPGGVIAGDYDIFCDLPEVGAWKPNLQDAALGVADELFDARLREALERSAKEGRPIAELIRAVAAEIPRGEVSRCRRQSPQG